MAPSGPSEEQVAFETYRAIQQWAPEMLMATFELSHVELIWAHGKDYVARESQLRRTPAKAWAREGWCGRLVGGRFEGAEEGGKLVRHSVKEVQQ